MSSFASVRTGIPAGPNQGQQRNFPTLATSVQIRHNILPPGLAFLVILATAGPVLGSTLPADSPQFPDLTVQVSQPEGWQAILSSVGLEATNGASRYRIAVGDSTEATAAGFTRTDRSVRVAAVIDQHDPALPIFWEEPLDLPFYKTPPNAKIFMREKRTGAPLLAGWSNPGGGLLWAITDPGPSGYERFPFLVHALRDLGLRLPFRGARTWAFFDYSYRSRADPSYLARRWRQAGLSAIHASAWHFHEPDSERDAYLKNLIEACHREGVLVYAWLELPHVSERFWADNAGCREKTAVLQDAHLDWRKLINLANPSCFDKVAGGVHNLLRRFDWDGVNLAELYFESLHGPSNPPRFTPLNDWVRHDAAARFGFDPLQLFDASSTYFWSRNPQAWQQFVDYRAELLVHLHERWLSVIRAALPEADIAVTQIDDRFDPRMRELLGADTAALRSLREAGQLTLVIEDPATLWDLGPQRYPAIAEKYAAVAAGYGRLAIDINVVERYQQTYPAKKQVGTEFLQLLHLASRAFPQVLLYCEHSIARADLALAPFASGRAQWRPPQGGDAGESRRELSVRADGPLGVNLPGPVLVNGRPWPVADDSTAWLPPGDHTIRPGGRPPPLRILHLNGDLLAAGCTANQVYFEYHSLSRAIALVDARPGAVTLDGRVVEVPFLKAPEHFALLLPRGRHSVRLSVEGLIP